MSATGSPSTSTPAATQVALTAEPHSTELSVKCVAPEYSIALILSNGTSLHHCFKLKTNAPRRWSVRPNGGVLAPGETAALSIKVIRTSADFRGIEDDRHLIVSVPVSPAEAVTLREQRAAAPRTSPARPDVSEPGASRTHITPRFATLPVPLPSEAATAGTAASSPAAPPGSTMYSPLPSPMVGALPGSPAVDYRRPFSSVANQVSAIDVRRHPTSNGAHHHGAAHMNGGSAHGSGSTPARAGGEEAAGGGAGGGDGDGDHEDRSGLLGKLLGVRAGDGRLGKLLKTISPIFSAIGEEFAPWLSWKVYDVLFAVLMLYLGRRLAWVRRAQELEIL
eukprot:jgi/Chrpa1/10676/Chrysochromulina_OHIO_Genome00006316-RA